MPPLALLRTNVKTLALLYIPNYNAGTDIHAVAPSGDLYIQVKKRYHIRLTSDRSESSD